MKPFRWNHDKNEQLKTGRDISFEEIVLAIEGDGLLDVLRHSNPGKYSSQRVFVVEVRGGLAFSDTGISGFLPGLDRREVHAKAET